MKNKRVKSRKRTYFGESAAGPLLNWLYGPAIPGQDKRPVEQLMDLGRRWNDSKNPHEREHLKQDINVILLDMKFNPVVVTSKRKRTVLWEAVEYGSASDAVRLWLELLSLGALARLKRCAYKKCGKWFFARFAHNSFHSIPCRDASAKEDEKRREERRKYERNNNRKNHPIWK